MTEEEIKKSKPILSIEEQKKMLILNTIDKRGEYWEKIKSNVVKKIDLTDHFFSKGFEDVSEVIEELKKENRLIEFLDGYPPKKYLKRVL